MTRIPENKQSRLRQYIGAPKRFLRKARDFYVDSMVNFDGKVGTVNVVASCPATHISQLPNNFGTRNSSKLEPDKENLEELYRSVSKKFNWSGIESEKEGMNDRRGRTRGYVNMDRSYSIALGKIGTIDEEEPCEFHENVTMKSETLLFPRSRSHAVTRNNVYY